MGAAEPWGSSLLENGTLCIQTAFPNTPIGGYLLKLLELFVQICLLPSYSPLPVKTQEQGTHNEADNSYYARGVEMV
jgi:hypothetical protein